MSKPFLVVAEVRKNYGKTVALQGVNLTVNTGELFGLLGPNGAGKTTLLAILAGLSNPDSGSVTLNGQRFGTHRRDLRSLVGIATQDLAIYPELTARENLTFFGRLYGMSGQDLTQRVDQMLQAVALHDRADQRTGTFSGGMKRRLNLAVAVVHRPRLLLLDEPTTGVDPQSRNHIFEQVRTLNAAGMTVLYTSHYMEEVQSLCPRIAILDAGQIQACDTLSNLLRRCEAVAQVAVSPVTESLLTNLTRISGVIRCQRTELGLDLTAEHLAVVLPRLIEKCSAAGATITALDLIQPSLERVFLSLTGKGLRD